MSPPSRAVLPTLSALSALALLALALPMAHAQPTEPAQPGPRAARPAKPAAPSSLDLVPWFSLEQAGAGLIRAPGAGRPLDLAARQEDDTNIIVYGRHKAVDPRSDREHDFSAPGWSEIAMPRNVPIGPASSCSSGAYRTIGGQPATGMDLVGGLGGGRC